MNTTPEERAELRAKAEAATPGEWIDAKDPDRAGWRVINGQRWPIAGRMISQNSAHVAAASPQTVLRLLDDIEEMQRWLDAAERGLSSALWVGNNLHNYGSDVFLSHLRAAVEDARVAYDTAEAGTA